MIESVGAMNIRGQKFLHEMLDRATVISGPPGSGKTALPTALRTVRKLATGTVEEALLEAEGARSLESHRRTARHRAEGPDGVIVITGSFHRQENPGERTGWRYQLQ